MWKLQSNYFPPRFHVRVPWGMKNVYGRPPKRFSFLYVLGTKILKHTQNWNDLSRFIFLYSIILWIVKYGSCLLTIQLSATFQTHMKIYKIKLMFKGQNWSLFLKNTCGDLFLRHFFLSNWETSVAALLSCHKWEPWYDCIKNGLIHGQRGMRLIFLMLASIFHPSLPSLPPSISYPLKVSLTICILMYLFGRTLKNYL